MKLQKKIAILGILVAQAMVLSLVETMIPIPIAIPGVKLGLANLITLFAIREFRLREVLMVVVARSVLTFFIVGVLSSFLFSLAGGVFSCLVMFVFNKLLERFFGIISVSVMGALAHNVAQLGVALVLMRTWRVLAYVPVLMMTGVATGILIGISAKYTIKPLGRVLRIGSDNNVE